MLVDGEVFFTPLSKAVAAGELSSVKELLAEGVNPDEVHIDGRTPLIIACQKDNPEIVRVLLEHSAKTQFQDPWGNTPLHCAKSVAVCRELLRNAADLEATNCFGDTPLHMRMRARKYDVCKYLIEAGAIVTVKDSLGRSVVDYINSNLLRTMPDAALVELIRSRDSTTVAR